MGSQLMVVEATDDSFGAVVDAAKVLTVHEEGSSHVGGFKEVHDVLGVLSGAIVECEGNRAGN